MKTTAFAPKVPVSARRTIDIFGPALALSLSLFVTLYYLLKINPASPGSRPDIRVGLSAFPAHQKNKALFPSEIGLLLTPTFKPKRPRAE